MVATDVCSKWLRALSTERTARTTAARAVCRDHLSFVHVHCRYPAILTPVLASKVIKPPMEPLPHGARYCVTWRGGGFRDDHKQFFEDLMASGQHYRIPGFLATSTERNTAMGFLGRADKKHPRILWIILVRTAACLDVPIRGS